MQAGLLAGANTYLAETALLLNVWDSQALVGAWPPITGPLRWLLIKEDPSPSRLHHSILW